MHGRVGASDLLPAALEFEGRFMSSRPITNNSLWWHVDQNPGEQQLPDFIPLGSDEVPSHYDSLCQSGWNADRLNVGQSSLSSMKTQSGCNDQLMENERISTVKINAGSVSGSNNHVRPSNGNVSNSNLIRPVVLQNSRSTDVVPSRRPTFEHISTASSSAQLQIELVPTSSLLSEKNNAGAGPKPAVETIRTSEKRKHPEGSWEASSAIERKRSVQVSGSSGVQAPLSVSSSSANVIGVGSSEPVQSGPESGLAGRSQGIQQDIQIQNTQIRTDNSLQESLLERSDLSGIDIRHNSYPAVQRPRLVLPPPQVVGRGSNFQNLSSIVLPPSLAAAGSSNVQNHSMSVARGRRLVLPPPQEAGEIANFLNYPMPVNYPATLQQSSQLTRHHSAPSVIPRNTSNYSLATGTIEVHEVVSRNPNQTLQLPMIPPPIGSRNFRQNPTNLVPSSGVAFSPVNASAGLPSEPIPSGPRPVPNLISNDTLRRGMEQVRQALLAADSMQGTSNPASHEIRLQSGPTSQRIRTIQHGATLSQTYVRNHSNSGALGQNATTSSFDAPTRQRILSHARRMFALYRGSGGRDIQANENVANARQSLFSALARMHDQHRDMRLDVDNMSYEELLELGDRIGHVKTGLSEDTIMKCMKLYKYTAIMKSSKPDAEPCSICQEDYAEGEDLGALECGHEYHTNCIKQWLVQKNSCPFCKVAASSSK